MTSTATGAARGMPAPGLLLTSQEALERGDASLRLMARTLEWLMGLVPAAVGAFYRVDAREGAMSPASTAVSAAPR